MAGSVPIEPTARTPRAVPRLSQRWQGLIAGLRVYADPRMMIVFFLGGASGLPLALTAGTFTIWLARTGVDKSTIGLLTVVALPYTLKFLWAPLVDRLPIPGLGRWLGRRRGWALATQFALMAAIAAMALTDPASNPGLLAVFALLVAIASASQDIVLDAYRVEILDPPQYGAGAATFVFGYRLGMLVSGAGALYLADVVSWREVYLIMAGALLIGMATVLLAREPKVPLKIPDGATLAQVLRSAIIEPLLDFMKRPLWLAILLFVFLFKLGDALAGTMTGPFMVELGFTNTEIANISKIYGFIATIVGLALGGYLIPRFGVVRTLWAGGILQMLSNLLFALQATLGHDLGALAVTIGVENFSGGIGTAALVAYLSGLCNLLYTATQYALLSALASAARAVLGAPTGKLAEVVDWVTFFGLTAALALPGLATLAWLNAKRGIGPLKSSAGPNPHAD